MTQADLFNVIEEQNENQCELHSTANIEKDGCIDDDCKDFLEKLISSEMLKPIEEGITKIYLHKGCDALSTKQRHVFDTMMKKHSVSECTRCGCPIPWNEMYAALRNGGLCNYCEYMQEKINKE